MAISKEEIAGALGVPATILETVLSTGFRQVQLDGLYNIIQYAKLADAGITATEQAEIDAVMQPILEKRSRRANHIAAWEAHWSESKASPNGAVTVPTQEEVDALLNEA